ncbi:hypothetical protein RvY_14027 [Ramazzottius varieornatus]|uniref:Uncharacterized protein n=1 Tax=Ramazzottius varieornatus TaxID=947166 RepID=A0A1D1VRM7_RAMVA|nr:hypothetical protein RvY_14027 [Ramazzottius varieornatus]
MWLRTVETGKRTGNKGFVRVALLSFHRALVSCQELWVLEFSLKHAVDFPVLVVRPSDQKMMSSGETEAELLDYDQEEDGDKKMKDLTVETSKKKPVALAG